MELNTSFLRYNLRNTVNVPTRNTKSTSKLLDVITVNKKNYKLIQNYYSKQKLIQKLLTTVMDLGLSDHYAHMLFIPFKNFSNMPQRVKNRMI